MNLISLAWHNPVEFAIIAAALLYSIIAHELAHGLIALAFGDPTAWRSGRLTLNPIPHIDPRPDWRDHADRCRLWLGEA
jgi:Zn-dependent protease